MAFTGNVGENPTAITTGLMMKKWRVKQVSMVDKAQERVIDRVVSSMNKAMKIAIDQIWDTYEKTGIFIQPTFNGMLQATQDYYDDVLKESYSTTKRTISMQGEPIKKLSKLPSFKLPKDMSSLEKVLKNKRYYREIMRRAAKLTWNLKKQYLKKIKLQMSKIVPLIESGELSPRDAQKQMMEAWGTSKSRVRTIFTTETTSYFAKAQTDFFGDEEDIIGFLFDSVRHKTRTKICESRHGLVYRPNTSLLKQNTPACHYGCYSHLIPLANTPENIKLLKDPARDPEKRKVEPLPRGWRK